MTPAAPSRPPGERGHRSLRLPGPLLAALALGGLALGAAVVWSGLDPRDGAPRVQGLLDIWLLTSFVLGVLLLLFGASARLSGKGRSGGAREGLAGLRKRAEALERGEAKAEGGGEDTGPERTGDVATGIMAAGGWLLLLYAVVWLVRG